MIACTLLGGCAVGHDYAPPKNTVDDHWGALNPPIDETDDTLDTSGISVSEQPVLPSGPWWEQFGDDTLSALMQAALEDNNDLKVANARLNEARSNEFFTTSQLFPQVNADASISRASLDTLNSGKADTVKQAGINGSWNIDLFGANIRRNQGAAADVQASEYDLAQAQINILSDVALNYCHLRAAQKQQALILRNLGTQNDTLRVTRELRKAQDVTELDVARVQAQIAATQARLPQIRTSIYGSIHRLSVLTGRQPATLRQLLLKPQPMPELPENLVVLSPVSVIAQRPDIRAAERRLAETSALSGAAFADFFPQISLSTFFGTRHSDLFGSLSPWSATADAMFPLLDFGRLRAQMHGADARQEQALYSYRQVVLSALEETENNLVAYMAERKRSALLQEVAVEENRAFGIAREQYQGGIVTQLDLLDVERNQLDAESNFVLSQQTALDNLIGLYHALGQGPVNSQLAEGVVE